MYSVPLAIQLLSTLAKTLGKYLKMEVYNYINFNSVAVNSMKLLTLCTSVSPLLHDSSM